MKYPANVVEPRRMLQLQYLTQFWKLQEAEMKKFQTLYLSNTEIHSVSIVDRLRDKDKTNVSVEFMNLAPQVIILSKQHNSILSALSYITVFCIKKKKKAPQSTTSLGHNSA